MSPRPFNRFSNIPLPAERFVAVDVETANFEPSSICAIGACKVEDGIVKETRYSLVCPEPNYYNRTCMDVHGLCDDDTFDAPSFGTVWSSWSDWLDGHTLVAHNAAFDSKCIRAACRIYGLAEPEDWADTLAVARIKISKFVLPSKSLDSLCEFFGIPLEHHHNASDDAMACAKLAITLNNL